MDQKMGKCKHMKFKNVDPDIYHKKLTQRAILLKNTSRKGISKIARLKTAQSMLKGCKSKIDTRKPLQNAPLAK